jgi:hypothetical protein
MKTAQGLMINIIVLFAFFSIGGAQPKVVSVKDLGVVAQPATVISRDGGFTTRAGGKILWTFADTFFNTPAADSATYRSNTAALADPSRPLQVIEPLDGKKTPFAALAFTKAEQAFNDSTKSPTNRIALWISGLVPDSDGSALAFYSKVHVKSASNFDFLGVGTAHFRPDSTAGERDPNLLFGANEPIFTKAFLHDGMVYLYGGITGGGLAQPHFLARAPLGQATQRSAYRFWNGSAWDSDVNKRAQVFGGVGSGLTVAFNAYLQSFTAVYSPIFSNKVVMRTSGRPEGPWSLPIDLFTGMSPAQGSNNRQGKQHAELASNDGQTIYASYFHPTASLRGDMRLVEVVLVLSPAAPTLAFPPHQAANQPMILALQWNATPRAEKYRLQLSTTADFSMTVVDDSTLATTSRQLGPLANNNTYFWRVNAKNLGGVSAWSEVRRFTTIALPSQVVLLSPIHAAVLTSGNVKFTWRQSQPEISGYWFEIAADSSMKNAVIDSTIQAMDTTKVVLNLIDKRTYWWRVRAKNVGGWGPFSAQRRFGIEVPVSVEAAADISMPTEFSLRQNYPNPLRESAFTASTTIEYALPKPSPVVLKVYDVLGNEVQTLVHGKQPMGKHRVQFEGKGLPVGVYFYRIQAGEFVQTKKLTVVQ